MTAQHRLSELQALQELLVLLSERLRVTGGPESTAFASQSDPILGGPTTEIDVDQSSIEGISTQGISAFTYYVDAVGDIGLSSTEMLEVARLLEWGNVLAEMPPEET